MAKVSGINSSGCSRKAGAGKQELRTDYYYQYTYTYDMVMKLLRNKALIISDRENGSYNACELLIDLEAIEREYLSELQRKIINYKYVYMYTNQEVAELMGFDRWRVAKELANIENTLSEVLEHDL